MNLFLQLFEAREVAPNTEVSFGIIFGLLLFTAAVVVFGVLKPIMKMIRAWRSMPRAR